MRLLTSHKTKQTAGFTLIELLVVILIAAILAAIAAPGWLGFMNRQRVGAVRSDLVQSFRSAQIEARQRRQDVTVTVTNENSLPTLRVNGAAQVLGSDNAGNVQLTAYSINADGTRNTATTSISFDYQGIPIGNNVPFVVSISTTGSSARQCAIVANLLGSIKTAEGAACDNPGL